METLYIALVSTPGLFADIIRWRIGIEYCHVVLSLDANFERAYSFGRRDPAIPWFSGFVREDSGKILRKFPGARYRVLRLRCTGEQKERIRRYLEECHARRRSLHYCILGLPFLLFDRPFYQRDRYTCSSFAARLLEENGMPLFNKHFSLVTPRDFYELAGTELLYEGLLREYLGGRERGWETAECDVA